MRLEVSFIGFGDKNMRPSMSMGIRRRKRRKIRKKRMWCRRKPRKGWEEEREKEGEGEEGVGE